jgi:hypothetical protein
MVKSLYGSRLSKLEVIYTIMYAWLDQNPLIPIYFADKPWVWNVRYMEPDSQGNVWTPS